MPKEADTATPVEPAITCQACGCDYLKSAVAAAAQVRPDWAGCFCSEACEFVYVTSHGPPRVTDEIVLGDWRECTLGRVVVTDDNEADLKPESECRT